MRLGRYTLQRRVGSGGMAEVWKAVFHGPEGFEKDLAIKRVLPHLAADREFISMFVDEAKLVAKLAHPNIVQVFDFGVAEETVNSEKSGTPSYFLAFEYVDGQNLAALVKRVRDRGMRIPLHLALFIASEAAKALAFAHSATDASGKPLSIIHRDVSPHNILASYGGEVKVADFGIARAGRTLPRSEGGVLRGKISYFSPEQASFKPMDSRSDLFSLGLVLYELLTLERLFQGVSGDEVVGKISKFNGLTDEQRAAIPEEVRGIVERALQPVPDDRYPDAHEMETGLTYLMGLGGLATGRTGLASLLQELFADDRMLETVPIPDEPMELLTGSYGGATSTAVGAVPDLGIGEEWEHSKTRVAGEAAPERPARERERGREFPAERQTNPSETRLSPIFAPDAFADIDEEDRATREGTREHKAAAGVLVEPTVLSSVSEPSIELTVEEGDVIPGDPVDDKYVSRSKIAPPPSPEGKPPLDGTYRAKRDYRKFGFAGLAMLAALLGGWRLSTWISERLDALAVATVTDTPWHATPDDSAVTAVATDTVSPLTTEVASVSPGESPIWSHVASPASTRATTSTPAATPAHVVQFTPRPTFTATPRATQTRRATPTPRKTAVAMATPRGDPGWLTVRADPWVEVWINGKQIAPETPLRRHPLLAGRYTLKVANPGSGYEGKQVIQIESGKESLIFVDVPNAKIKVEN